MNYIRYNIIIYNLLYIYMVAPPPRAHLTGRECITYKGGVEYIQRHAQKTL